MCNFRSSCSPSKFSQLYITTLCLCFPSFTFSYHSTYPVRMKARGRLGCSCSAFLASSTAPAKRRHHYNYHTCIFIQAVYLRIQIFMTLTPISDQCQIINWFESPHPIIFISLKQKGVMIITSVSTCMWTYSCSF